MQLARFFGVVCVLAAMAGSTSAQLPFGSGATVIKNATVFTEGRIVENCHLLFAGKKIKAVGRDIKIPDDAEVIDGHGRFILPALIDPSASMGLLDPKVKSRLMRAHMTILDRLNLFDLNPFRDALREGVLYAYLRNPATRGVGGQGAGVRLPRNEGEQVDDLAVAPSRAIHVRLGTAGGPFGRYAEVQGFKSQLLGAKKYRESWKKYEESLKKYLEGLKKSGKSSSTKKSEKKGSRPKAKKGSGRVSAPSPFVDEDHDHDHDSHGTVVADEPFDPAEVQSWDIWSLGDLSQDPYVLAQRARAEQNHGDLNVALKWQAPAPQLSPELTHLYDDGTEPQVRRPTREDPNDPSTIEILVCRQCGGEIEGQPHHHPREEGFDFWEFAPDPRRKSTSKKSSGKEVKRPKEPRYDPAREAMADILEGKVAVRIEVHRAEDIRNLLKVMEVYPMRAVLEGVTEGYLVAEELAKAEVPVVVFADAVPPIQEKAAGTSGSQLLPFGFRGFFRRAPSSSVAGGSIPVEGLYRPDNAALMAAKGVRVAISPSRRASEASPQLLLAAARLAGQGLKKEKALSAVTEVPADILGLGDQVGALKKGRRATFVILDGDPLNPATQVQTVYMDGETYYKKK